MTTIPLYKHYRGQVDPQPAFIEFDLRGGPITAGYSGEIGNAVPHDVWHGLIRRIPVSPYVTEEALDGFISSEKTAELVELVRGNSQVVWNGHNYVGRLNEAAEEALGTLANLAKTLPTVQVWEPEDWLSMVLRREDGLAYINGELVLPDNVDILLAEIPNEVDGAICPNLGGYLRHLAEQNAQELALREEDA